MLIALYRSSTRQKERCTILFVLSETWLETIEWYMAVVLQRLAALWPSRMLLIRYVFDIRTIASFAIELPLLRVGRPYVLYNFQISLLTFDDRRPAWNNMLCVPLRELSMPFLWR